MNNGMNAAPQPAPVTHPLLQNAPFMIGMNRMKGRTNMRSLVMVMMSPMTMSARPIRFRRPRSSRSGFLLAYSLVTGLLYGIDLRRGGMRIGLTLAGQEFFPHIAQLIIFNIAANECLADAFS